LHSSGLKDQYGDDANGTAEDYPNQLAPGGLLARFVKDLPAHMECLQDPACDGSELITLKHWNHWDPEQPDDPYAGMVNYYANQMGYAGFCAPGTCFHYSDVGYVILGLIAEKAGGKSLHGLFRERIFDPLSMDSSYLAYGVYPDASAWEVAVSDFDLGGIPAVSAGINLSFDWGGGGVVSTAPELNRFFRALLEGKLFSNTDTLEQMIDWQVIPGLEEYMSGIGLGLFRFKGPGGVDFWAKFGAWGGGMIFDPATGAYIAGTQNGRQELKKYWSTQIVSALREASK
jgi:D-alanyl-D-alanine carboxypeptidase